MDPDLCFLFKYPGTDEHRTYARTSVFCDTGTQILLLRLSPLVYHFRPSALEQYCTQLQHAEPDQGFMWNKILDNRLCDRGNDRGNMRKRKLNEYQSLFL